MIQIFFGAFANLHNEIISEIEQFHPESTIFYPFWKTFSLNKTLLIVSQSFPLCDIDHDTHIGFADCWLLFFFSLELEWYLFIFTVVRRLPSIHSSVISLSAYMEQRVLFFFQDIFLQTTLKNEAWNIE